MQKIKIQFDTVSVRTFIIPFYFGSGSKSGSARKKSSRPDQIHNTALRSQLLCFA
jgi:hypothetical protein